MHCVHGKKVAMIETVLDWRPFQYFTVSQDTGVFKGLSLRLMPTANGGTCLEVRERGRLTTLPFLLTVQPGSDDTPLPDEENA
jgi:hypothetical protein